MRPAMPLMNLTALWVRWLSAGVVVILCGTPPAVAADGVPRRVVSMNLCTDQVAMLLAKPGQLHSVSHLARQESVSALPFEAETYRANHGRAEEIFLMAPDLVLASTMSSRASVDLLRRLGIRVEEISLAQNFDDIRANIGRIGVLLGQSELATREIAEFDRRLGEATAARPSTRPVAVLFSANGYTSGEGTLATAIVDAAGFENGAASLGLAGNERLPLELLVITRPNLIVTRSRGARLPARAAEVLRHPAIRKIRGQVRHIVVSDRYWICGTPFTVEAVRNLAKVREGLADVEIRLP